MKRREKLHRAGRIKSEKLHGTGRIKNEKLIRATV